MTQTEEQKGICYLQLNNVETSSSDPTLLKLTFSILDFEVSGNKQVVDLNVALEASPTLAYKPLLAQYFPTTDYENPNDHFGDHGYYIGKDRKGNDILKSNTLAIGTASEKGGYLGTIIDDQGNEVSVLLCDFYVWVDKYPDIANLIIEMWESGLVPRSSCEYLYKNYKVENGIQHVLSPIIFLGHCILNSGENDTGVVEPAYKNSKLVSINERWERAVAQAIKNQSEKSVEINSMQKEENLVTENLLYKALCELSFGDIREKLMEALSKTMSADEFKYVYISNYGIYDTYFVYENYENSEYVYYKVPYTKTETDVTIDLANRTKVVRENVWVEVSQLEAVQNSLNSANALVEELKTQLKEKDQTIASLNATKEELANKFNEATETVTSLNAKVIEMESIVEKYKAEQIEKAINEKKEYYSAKFKAVNALDKYESEEVQNLIKLSINEGEEGKNAILTLNSMLVDLVQVSNENKTSEIREYSSVNQKLIPTSTDFDSRYQEE